MCFSLEGKIHHPLATKYQAATIAGNSMSMKSVVNIFLLSRNMNFKKKDSPLEYSECQDNLMKMNRPVLVTIATGSQLPIEKFSREESRGSHIRWSL